MRTSELFITGGVAACFLFAGNALGQWSSDSLLNLQICDLTGDQVIPKIAETTDGGCFISWFDSRNGSYCLYLQRLDYQGNTLFPENGLLVSDHAQQTWLVDYDMEVDANDNAVLVFSDTRNEPDELDVSAYKIGSDGTFLWGPDGICLSNPGEPGFEPYPTLAITGNGNCVVTWGKATTESFLVFQKLSPAGEKLWGDWGITLESAADLSTPFVTAAGEDSVIVLWKSATGSFPSQVISLYTQKFDMNGVGVWGDTPMLIYDSGAITAWNNPEIISDGNNGAVYSWYDSPDLSTFNVWVQHIDSGGNLLFPANGAQASTNSTDRLHMYPSATCNSANGEICVFWVEENDNQNQYGLYGQRFSPAGDRLWTDSGLELLPLASSQISPLAAVDSDEPGIFIGYLYGTPNAALRTVNIDYDGTVLWGPVTLSAGSLGDKGDLQSCPGFDQSAFYAWNDSRNSSGIFAQNVHQDGSLGPYLGISGAAPGTDLNQLSVFPNPSNGMITVSFIMETAGSASLEIYDMGGRLAGILASGELGPGEHSVSWQRDSGIATGIYMLRLKTGGNQSVSRLVLL